MTETTTRRRRQDGERTARSPRRRDERGRYAKAAQEDLATAADGAELRAAQANRDPLVTKFAIVCGGFNQTRLAAAKVVSVERISAEDAAFSQRSWNEDIKVRTGQEYPGFKTTITMEDGTKRRSLVPVEEIAEFHGLVQIDERRFVMAEKVEMASAVSAEAGQRVRADLKPFLQRITLSGPWKQAVRVKSTRSDDVFEAAQEVAAGGIAYIPGMEARAA